MIRIIKQLSRLCELEIQDGGRLVRIKVTGDWFDGTDYHRETLDAAVKRFGEAENLSQWLNWWRLDLADKTELATEQTDASNRKYEFTGETRQHDGGTLRQIRRISDGEIGGWIKSEANLSHEGDCWVSDSARVCDNARVYGNAQVSGEAWVYVNAHVYGNAQVSGKSQVYGSAHVSGNAQVSGKSQVYGSAHVSGKSQVYGSAHVSDDVIG